MKTYALKFEQHIPVSLDEAWDFFSSPLNLSKITPRQMKFVITSDYTPQTKMYAGMIIIYKVSPLFGIPLNWVTEITHVQEKQYFVDKQRFGPYALWHHQHHFKAIEGGVHMTDLLHYAIPYGVIGRATNKLIVDAQLQKIFSYREKAIEQLFGKFSAI